MSEEDYWCRFKKNDISSLSFRHKQRSLTELPLDGSPVVLHLSTPESISLVKGLGGVAELRVVIETDPSVFFDRLIQAGLGYIEKLSLVLRSESSLNGIEFFDSLKRLQITYDLRTTEVINLSVLESLPSLETLIIDAKYQAQIIVQNCQMLENIDIQSCLYSSEDLTPASKLTVINSPRLGHLEINSRRQFEIDLDRVVKLKCTGPIVPQMIGIQPTTIQLNSQRIINASCLGTLKPSELILRRWNSHQLRYLDTSCLKRLILQFGPCRPADLAFLNNIPILKTIRVFGRYEPNFQLWNESLPEEKRFQMGKRGNTTITYRR